MFFLDRGLGSRIIPDGLRVAGWTLTTMDERYGFERSQDIADTEWIRDAATAGDCILTKDSAIARRPAEAQAVYSCAARVFTIKRATLTGPQMLSLLLDRSDAILRFAQRVDGPFVVGIGPNRLERLHLNYP